MRGHVCPIHGVPDDSILDPGCPRCRKEFRCVACLFLGLLTLIVCGAFRAPNRLLYFGNIGLALGWTAVFVAAVRFLLPVVNPPSGE